MKKRGFFALGLAAGMVVSGCVSAFASDGSLSDAVQHVTASINDSFSFIVDDKLQTIPDEYSVIVYNNRSYLPVRAVGEMLGADIEWDGNTNTAYITTKENEPDDDSDVGDNSGDSDDNSDIDSNDEGDGDNADDNGNAVKEPEIEYKELPQVYENTYFRVTAEAYFTDSYGDRLYLSIKNKEDGVLRLVSSKTTYKIDGKEYTYLSALSGYWDTRWYTQYMEKDDELEGYIRLPRGVTGFENMSLHVELQYDGKTDTHSIDFDIAV